MEELLFEDSLLESMEIISFEERDMQEIVRENAHALLDAEMDLEEILYESSNEIILESNNVTRFIGNVFKKIKELLIRFKNWLVSLFSKSESAEKTEKKNNEKREEKEKSKSKSAEQKKNEGQDEPSKNYEPKDYYKERREKEAKFRKRAIDEAKNIDVTFKACKMDERYMRERCSFLENVIDALEDGKVQTAINMMDEEESLDIEGHLLYDEHLRGTDYVYTEYEVTNVVSSSYSGTSNVKQSLELVRYLIDEIRRMDNIIERRIEHSDILLRESFLNYIQRATAIMKANCNDIVSCLYKYINSFNDAKKKYNDEFEHIRLTYNVI